MLKKRIWVNAKRVKLLQKGKIVNIKQDDISYELTPITYCCPLLRALVKRHPRSYLGFKMCPYCGKNKKEWEE